MREHQEKIFSKMFSVIAVNSLIQIFKLCQMYMLKEIKKTFICQKIITVLIESWQFSSMIYQHGVTKQK